MITGDIRNRGNIELSRQSSCFIRQGTKVDSTEECDQVISTLHRVRQVSAILSQEELVYHQPYNRHPVPLASQQYSPPEELVYGQPKGGWVALKDINIPQRSIGIHQQASPAVLI